MRFPSIVLLALLGLLAWSGTAHAARSFDSCKGFITSVPTTIKTSGTWCLNQNLKTSITTGAAITVTSNSVTIDCNDFVLDDTRAGTGSAATGIYSTDQYYLTVRHCKIRGFYRGVDTEGGSCCQKIEDNHLDGNLLVGIKNQVNDSIIRHNFVAHTGGTTSTAAPYTAYGIFASANNLILDNEVSGVAVAPGSNASVQGIGVQNNTWGSINGNTVRGLVPDGTGTVGGILIILPQLPHPLAVRNNSLKGGGFPGNGIECNGANASYPTVRAMDNVISGFGSAAIAKCGDAGENDTSP